MSSIVQQGLLSSACSKLGMVDWPDMRETRCGSLPFITLSPSPIPQKDSSHRISGKEDPKATPHIVDAHCLQDLGGTQD